MALLRAHFMYEVVSSLEYLELIFHSVIATYTLEMYYKLSSFILLSG